MWHKAQKAGIYLLVTVISNAAYGFILYLLFTWLSVYSLLHAYIGNLVFIVLILAIDEYALRVMQSDKLILMMRKEKDQEKFYCSLQRGLGYVGSFKADLYSFYVIVLIFSQIVKFNPALVGENIGNFIHANDYSIILLVAIDTLKAQITKDREKIKKTLEKLKDSMTDSNTSASPSNCPEAVYGGQEDAVCKAADGAEGD